MNPPTVTTEWLCAYCDTPNPTGRTNCERCHTIWSWRPESDGSGDDAVAYAPPVAEPARGPAWLPALVIVPLLVIVAVLGYFVSIGSLFGPEAEQVAAAPSSTDQEVTDATVEAFEAHLRELGFVATPDEGGEGDAGSEIADPNLASQCEADETWLGDTATTWTETGYSESAQFERAPEMPGRPAMEFANANVSLASSSPSLAQLDRAVVEACVGEWFRQGFYSDTSVDSSTMSLDGPYLSTVSATAGDSGIRTDAHGWVVTQGVRVPFKIVFDVIQDDRSIMMLLTGWVGDGVPVLDRALLLNRLLGGVTAA